MFIDPQKFNRGEVCLTNFKQSFGEFPKIAPTGRTISSAS